MHRAHLYAHFAMCIHCKWTLTFDGQNAWKQRIYLNKFE